MVTNEKNAHQPMLEIGFSSALFLTATGAIFILSMLVNAPIG